jgi:hypothetical protein
VSNVVKGKSTAEVQIVRPRMVAAAAGSAASGRVDATEPLLRSDLICAETQAAIFRCLFSISSPGHLRLWWLDLVGCLSSEP